MKFTSGIFRISPFHAVFLPSALVLKVFVLNKVSGLVYNTCSIIPPHFAPLSLYRASVITT